MFDPGHLPSPFFETIDHFARSLHRGRVWKLNIHEQVTLVLLGNESSRNSGHRVIREEQQSP